MALIGGGDRDAVALHTSPSVWCPPTHDPRAVASLHPHLLGRGRGRAVGVGDGPPGALQTDGPAEAVSRHAHGALASHESDRQHASAPVTVAVTAEHLQGSSRCRSAATRLDLGGADRGRPAVAPVRRLPSRPRRRGRLGNEVRTASRHRVPTVRRAEHRKDRLPSRAEVLVRGCLDGRHFRARSRRRWANRPDTRWSRRCHRHDVRHARSPGPATRSCGRRRLGREVRRRSTNSGPRTRRPNAGSPRAAAVVHREHRRRRTLDIEEAAVGALAAAGGLDGELCSADTAARVFHRTDPPSPPAPWTAFADDTAHTASPLLLRTVR